MSDDEDDIEALRLAALESLKRNNDTNSQPQQVGSGPAYSESNAFSNQIQPVYQSFPSNEMGYQNVPPPEGILYQNNVPYPQEGLSRIPLHPVDNSQIDFGYPAPVDVPQGFHPEGPPPMMGPPPNLPFPRPPGPDGMFYPPPPGPMFNEIGGPLRPRGRPPRGKRGKRVSEFSSYRIHAPYCTLGLG